MRKSGFTLIELLAVIVVLAVIAIIAVPIILNVIEKSEKAAFEDAAYGIIDAGEMFFANNLVELGKVNERYDFEIQSNKFLYKEDISKELAFKGQMPKTGMLQINSNGKVAIAICNEEYCACKSTSELKVTIKDTNCNINSETGEIEENVSSQYPVGSIYISTTNTNPSTYFGGKWESYGEGRTLVGVGTGIDENSNTKTIEVNETNGEYVHTLTVDEMPKHTHGMNAYGWINNANSREVDRTGQTGNTFFNTITGATGGSESHNNTQPYIGVYMWKRIS